MRAVMQISWSSMCALTPVTRRTLASCVKCHSKEARISNATHVFILVRSRTPATYAITGVQSRETCGIIVVSTIHRTAQWRVKCAPSRLHLGRLTRIMFSPTRLSNKFTTVQGAFTLATRRRSYELTWELTASATSRAAERHFRLGVMTSVEFLLEPIGSSLSANCVMLHSFALLRSDRTFAVTSAQML